MTATAPDPYAAAPGPQLVATGIVLDAQERVLLLPGPAGEMLPAASTGGAETPEQALARHLAAV
ncbi:hypothetical protein, partial [Streptomyces sp. WAC06614]|uniref:hypothetical protein n=1 Tax=Streptomyces sp. WAC06614 TaxID=2487416 RepID=UPI000F91DB7D